MIMMQVEPFGCPVLTRSRPELFGHHLCAKYISWGPFSAYWNTHYLSQLARVRARVGLIYMENDVIMPPHQGGFISAGLQVPYLVLKAENTRV